MDSLEIMIFEARGCPRKNYIVEQGIPVSHLTSQQASRLTICDEAGRPVPASIDIEGFDTNGDASWLLLSFPVSLPAHSQARYILQEGSATTENGLKINGDENSVSVENRFFKAEFINPGEIRMSTAQGLLLDGDMGFDLRSDARSTVGGLRLAYYEPQGYEILQQTSRRTRLILRGSYRPRMPKSPEIDFRRGYDADVEFTVYADSPVIRL